MPVQKLDRASIRLLGLSHTEVRVLGAVRAGYETPLEIARHTKISRPAVYEILDRLHARRIVNSYIRNGKKYWRQSKEKDLEQELYETKKALLNIQEGVEEVRGLSDSTVVVHRGAEAVRSLLRNIMENHKEERFYGVQGDISEVGWEKVFSTEETNELNRFIKKNRIIMEAIVPDGWYERHVRHFGKKWAEDFEGRASVTHVIDPEYFKHGGQMWIFKQSLYLIALNEELVVEVRNSEIQKMILSFFRFVQDHSRKIDVNALLRKLLGKEKN